MARVTLKSVFGGIGLLAISAMIIIGVTDPEVFRQPILTSGPLNLFAFVADLWPRSTLIAAASVCVMFAQTGHFSYPVVFDPEMTPRRVFDIPF